MSLSSNLRAALRARPGRHAQDRAAEAVALTYAALIDNAAPAAKYRKALRLLARAVDRYRGDDADDVRDALELIATALGQHTVTSDLGPKMLAALASLAMTPAARGRTETPDAPQQQERPPSPLDELRGRRATRAARAAAALTR